MTGHEVGISSTEVIEDRLNYRGYCVMTAVTYVLRCKLGKKPYRECSNRCISCEQSEVVSIVPGLYVEESGDA